MTPSKTVDIGWSLLNLTRKATDSIPTNLVAFYSDRVIERISIVINIKQAEESIEISMENGFFFNDV